VRGFERAVDQTLVVISEAVSRAAAIGSDYESTLDDRARRRGAHYTPPDVALALVDRALRSWRGTGVPRVIDPACGAGVFLVATIELLVRRGVDLATALGSVHGADLDPRAIDAARRALEEWAGGDVSDVDLRVSDGLHDDLGADFDVVVGNPPFQGQLAADTARSARDRDAVNAGFGRASSGYVDTAALFLLRGTELAGRGGVVSMIQPRSILAARHSTAVRAELLDRAALVEMWLPRERVFAADVDLCAPLLVVGGSSARIVVSEGRIAAPVAEVDSGLCDGDSWAPLLAAVSGVPAVDLGAGPTIGTIADCTAGFRDQYYGLLGAVTETRPPDPSGRLVTSGAIDPLTLHWGERPIRFGRRTWRTPWIDLRRLRDEEPKVADWVDRLRRPKVLVATQTRVVEAVVDPDGDLVPVTPVIAVVPHDPDDVWMVAATLTAPPVAALAQRRLAGTGLSPGSVRLTASTVADLPLPPCPDEIGNAPSGSIDWRSLGARLCHAYDVEPGAILEWWLLEGPIRIDARDGVVVS
jgi:predicted RNA methylase